MEAFHSLVRERRAKIGKMERRYLGAARLEVPAIGLGCWGMSGAYGPADRDEALATLREAMESGVAFFDTADVYGAGENEKLLAEGLRGRRQHALIATKFGFRGNENGELEICGRPRYVREACDASLRRLKTDYIDLYYQHRVDKTVPIEETVLAMADLVKEGKVRYLGLSEASAETLTRANAVHPITAVQSEYSLLTRDVEKDVLSTCRKHGIGLVSFSPLGRGLLGGALRSRNALVGEDYRSNLPRFASENLDRNLALVEILETIAAARGATPAQIALAWVLQQSHDIVPIPGVKNRKHLHENLGALEIKLTANELEIVGKFAAAVQGERHNARNLGFLDQ
jgi:aryl-alcohol dehydrogenase-like predicted oxidoreductase